MNWLGRHDNKEYVKDQDSLDENDAIILNTPQENIFVRPLSLVGIWCVYRFVNSL